MLLILHAHTDGEISAQQLSKEKISSWAFCIWTLMINRSEKHTYKKAIWNNGTKTDNRWLQISVPNTNPQIPMTVSNTTDIY